MSSWTFTNLWNRSLEQREPRPVEKRDHLWASELSNSDIDLFLKLNGEPFTNPPNARSIRKFEAGDFWEAIVKHILLRSGVLKETQQHIKFQYPGLLEVTGKLDFLAGGKLDYDKAMKYAKNETGWMPSGFQRGVTAIIDGLHAEFKDVELKTVVLEVKSCSSYMMDAYEARGTGSLAHKLQAYHYLKGLGMDEAHIVYICRDDCRMLEIPVFAGQLEDEYKRKIESVTKAYRSSTPPLAENLIIYSDETGKITSNYKVEYSQYLSKLYGFETPMAYRDSVKKKLASFQRVIKRFANDDNITEANEEVIQDMLNYVTQKEIDQAIKNATKVADSEEEL